MSVSEFWKPKGALAYVTEDGETVTVEGVTSVLLDECAGVKVSRCNITAYSCSINASESWVGPLEIEGVTQRPNAFLLSDGDETFPYPRAGEKI